MTSNPTRPYGGNYSPPPHNFSQGLSSPPPGLNYNSPSPPINLPNPFLPSSIGRYPNTTFPTGMPPSFQPSFFSSSSILPSSAATVTIPSYVPPTPSFNPNPPPNLTFTSFQAKFGGNTPPIKPSFNPNPPPLTSSGTTFPTTFSGSTAPIPSYPQPVPSFSSNLSLGKSSNSTPPATSSSWIPSWSVLQPLSFFRPSISDYQITTPPLQSFSTPPLKPTASSPQPMDSFFLRKFEAQATSAYPNLGVVNFSSQLSSGRAAAPRTYASLGGSSHLSYGGTSWNPSFSSKDPVNSDRTVAKWTPGFLSTYGLKPPAIDPNFQYKMLGKFEETMGFMHMLRAGPENIFAGWESKTIAPVVIKINPQTTLFVDPFNVTDFFQRVSARAQESSANHDNPLGGAGRAVAIMHSTATHGMTKYVGIFVKNTLQTIEQLSGSPRRLSDKITPSQAWETKAVPAIHRAVDKAFQTNLGTNYNPNNDGRVQQFVQNAVLDPLVMLPWGHIAKAITVSDRVMKTTKVVQMELAAAHATGSRTVIMAPLKAGTPISSSVVTFREIIPKHLPPTGSYEFMENAQAFLKPYAKKFMTEMECRNLIHETGVRTFPRPAGIPDNFRVRIADKSAGLVYVHPEHNHTTIRVMPGKLHSPHPYQQKPYVIYRKNGSVLDKSGKVVDAVSPEAHIPIEEFVFKE